jgi:hypothetical protein
VLVKEFVHEVLICAGNEVIARHLRSHHLEDMIFPARRHWNPAHLLFDDGPVRPSDNTPATIVLLTFALLAVPEWVLRCSLFVDFDSPTGCFIDVNVAVFHLRTALENFANPFAEREYSWIPKL